MDARESLPSSPTSAVKDGAVEEDGLLTVCVAMAKEAEHLFQSRRLSECLDVLNRLLQMKKNDDKMEDDPKVLHNIAVAENFRDGCSNPKELCDMLYKVKKKSEELARMSGEQVEGANSPGTGSNVTSGYTGSSNTLLQLSAANTGRVIYADEFDTSVVTFNIAVVLYQMHEYKGALSVLWPLYQNIAPLDEAIALHVCLLLVDIALASQDASKAADVIQYLEKAFAGYLISQGDSGSIAQHQSSNQRMKISAATSNVVVLDASSSDSSAVPNVHENLMGITLSDDALEYENLYSTLDSGGQILGRPASNDLSKTPADRVAPGIDLKLKIHLYKVRLLLLTRNQKAAMREVKLAMNDARGRDSSTELVLKSQLEYSRGNHNKAVRLLDASCSKKEAAMQIIYNNNLGCIYHLLENHSLSIFYFSKALTTSVSLLSEKPLKLSIFSQDKSCLIGYNCGLQSLVCGNPLPAAQHFSKAAPMFEQRPLFWLRSAECCLLALRKGLLRSDGGAATSSGEEIRVQVLGSGRWRQLAVDDADMKNRYSDSSAQAGLLRAPSLTFARQCLRKTLILLDASESKASKSSGDPKASFATSASTSAGANDDSKETKGGPSSSSTLQSSVDSYIEMCRKENHLIRQAVLADLAYVQLCLDVPLRALSAAKKLQDLPECSGTHLFLGRVYATEALCHLNRLQEAAELLSVYIGDGNNVHLPYSVEDREKWSMSRVGDGEESKVSVAAKATAEDPPDWASSLKPEEARGVLYVNLAATLAMQGDLEQAAQFAKEALSYLPDNPRAVLAAVYVDLRQGKAQDALAKLRWSRHVRFLPGGATLSK